MGDLRLIETSNGGDLVLKGNDLEIINGFQNMPYLSLFGGNVGQKTPATETTGEQNFDYLLNALLFSGNSDVQMNSETEYKFNTMNLNSKGINELDKIIKEDLRWMQKLANVSIASSIVDIDNIGIVIRLQEPSTKQTSDYIYIWNATNEELTQVEADSSESISGLIDFKDADFKYIDFF